MKRIITLMMALALVFGAVANSSAADIKAKGLFFMEYAWMDNTNFNDSDADNASEDDFVAQQRFRAQIDITASENLKGVVYFEIDNQWGVNNGRGRHGGGQLETDGVNIETKRSYIDWTVPNTALSVRMGLQGLALPGTVAGSPILDDDVAAIVTTYKFNDMFSLNAFWARPYDTNTGDSAVNGYLNNSADEVDLFGLIAGIKLDGMEFTPYAVYGAIGAESAANNAHRMQSLLGSTTKGAQAYNATNWGSVAPNGMPDYVYAFNGTESTDDSRAYWLGLGFKMDMFDPIVLKLDGVYGAVENSDYQYRANIVNGTNGATGNGTALLTDDDILDRAGWMIAAKLSYKMDMVTPGIVAWYASGEDDDVSNGSERLPAIQGNFGPSSFGFTSYTGGNIVGTGELLGDTGIGMWGVGLTLEDIKVIDSLTSQFRVIYMEGTNDADVLTSLAQYTNVTGSTFISNNVNNGFLTDKDHAWEVNFDHKYDIYENLALIVEMGYINLDLDESTWGVSGSTAKYDDDAYKLGFIFKYSF